MAGRGFAFSALVGVLAAMAVVLLPVIPSGGLSAATRVPAASVSNTALIPMIRYAVGNSSSGIFASTMNQVNLSIAAGVSSVPHQGGLLVAVTLLPIFLAVLAGLIVYLLLISWS
jgi:hypothetical protein